MFYQIIKALQAALTIVWGDNQTVENIFWMKYIMLITYTYTNSSS